jgi:hypothetical protein
MDGMAGWKGVVTLARKRYAVEVATDRQSIGPFLVEQGFQEMGKRGGGKRRQQNVVAVAPIARAFVSAIEPPSDGQHGEHMFVRTPGESFGNLFGRRVGVFRDDVCDRDIAPGWSHLIKRHGSSFGR